MACSVCYDFNMDDCRMSELTPEEMKWVAIDLDATLCESSYPDYIPHHPLPNARRGVLDIKRGGYKVIIYTSRPWAHYRQIEDWLLKHKIPFDRIVCGKLLAKIYIDDRGYRFTSWGKDEVKKVLDIVKKK